MHIFDLQATCAENMRNEPIASTARYLKKGKRRGGSCCLLKALINIRVDRHKYAVTSVSWFPFDTGMFVTSSYDTTIKVWDTNEMKVKKKAFN